MSLAGFVAGAAVWLALTGRPRPPGRLTQLGPARPPRAERSPDRARLGAVVLTSVTAAVVSLALGGPLLAGLTTAGLLTVRWARAVRARKRRAERLAAEVPDLVDLLVIGLASGHGPREAMVRAIDLAPASLRAELVLLTAALDRGATFHDALTLLPASSSDPLRPVVSALLVHERDGVPVRATLDRLAADARQQRRQQAELAVRRLPVRLAFPLVCCTLSAFALLTVAPLLLAAVRSLEPAMP